MEKVWVFRLRDGRQICLINEDYKNLEIDMSEILTKLFNNNRHEYNLYLEYPISYHHRYEIDSRFDNYDLGRVIKKYIKYMEGTQYSDKLVVKNVDYRKYDVETIFSVDKYMERRPKIDYNKYDPLIHNRIVLFNAYAYKKINSLEFIKEFYKTNYNNSSLSITLEEIIKCKKYANILNYISTAMDLEMSKLKLHNIDKLVTSALMIFFSKKPKKYINYVIDNWKYLNSFISKFMELYTLALMENSTGNIILYSGFTHITFYLEYFKFTYKIIPISSDPLKFFIR